MSVQAIGQEYKGKVSDCVENFNGNQLVYVGWDHHMLFCSAFTFLVSPEAKFRTLIEDVIPIAFDVHPDWSDIEWSNVSWLLDGEPIQPQLDVTLSEQGIGHKSLLRIQTPELKGFKDTGV